MCIPLYAIHEVFLLPHTCGILYVRRLTRLCIFFYAGVPAPRRHNFSALTDYEWSVHLVRKGVIIFVYTLEGMQSFPFI